MRLGDFILRDMELILERWEAFATRVPAGKQMSSRALRDHGPEILKAIVADLATSQTEAEQNAKSMGLAPETVSAPPNAAQIHAALRADSGFDIEELAAEYRALRCSVLSGWLEACGPHHPYVRDMLRFNEAIDQALAESIASFTAHVSRSRNLLIGMLSHDLRSPLHTILTTAKLLRASNSDGEVGLAAGRLMRSGARMGRLLEDLIDFNRTELGLGLPVTPREVDLGQVCAEELEQIRATYPDRVVELQVVGDCRGSWDPDRIQQMLNNLVLNAFHYGAPHSTVRVAMRSSDSGLRLSVSNAGEPIEGETLAHIFEPLRRGKEGAVANNSGLGLGLYIAREITKAHGGQIGVDAVENDTVFTVSLPRIPRGAP